MNARVTLIAAVASNRVIGRDGQLPWKIPGDLPRFKRITWGQTLVMGRKTFESIGRALPGRHTVVVTHQLTFDAPAIEVAHTVDDALDRVRTPEAYVAGGAEVYAQAFPRAQRLMLTEVDAPFEGDVYFPRFDRSEWVVASDELQEPTDAFAHRVWLRTYVRG